MENNNKESFIQRLTKSVNYMFSGISPSTALNPGEPPKAISQELEAVSFDYPMNYNMSSTPKGGEGYSYEQLQFLSENCNILRLVIETRKDQVSRFKWKFVLKNNKKKTTNRKTEMLEEFFAKPDKERNFDTWIRKIMDNLLVIDSVAIAPRMTRGGEIHSFRVLDGSTIVKVIDELGDTPTDGRTAYQQKIHGLPMTEFAWKELVYRARNERPGKLYGYSPVEQVADTVNISIRKALGQLEYYTKGNTPNLLFTAPKEWGPDQIKKFQMYWDSVNSGIGKSRSVMLPPEVDIVNTKPEALKDEFDDWLARIVCFAFSIPPTAFVKDNNRATAQTTAQLAREEGLSVLLEWIRNLINDLVVDYFGFTDVEFIWDIEEEQDPLALAQIHQIYLDRGVLTPNEVRQELGLDPIEEVEQPQEPVPGEDTQDTQDHKQKAYKPLLKKKLQ